MVIVLNVYLFTNIRSDLIDLNQNFINSSNTTNLDKYKNILLYLTICPVYMYKRYASYTDDQLPNMYSIFSYMSLTTISSVVLLRILFSST